MQQQEGPVKTYTAGLERFAETIAIQKRAAARGQEKRPRGGIEHANKTGEPAGARGREARVTRGCGCFRGMEDEMRGEKQGEGIRRRQPEARDPMLAFLI